MTAVIDIGSNSVRLGYPVRGIVTAKKINTTALAEGLTASGFLSPAALQRTAAAVEAYADEARAADATDIKVFATEAVRSAANGGEIIAEVKRLCGLDVVVLSQEQEARAAYLGAADGLKEATVIDIGGGSAEIICGYGGEIVYAESFPLGAVRLKEACDNDRAALDKYIARYIKDGIPCITPIIGVGGTATSQYVIKENPSVYSAQEVHNQIISAAELRQITDKLFEMTPEQITQKYPLISPRRAAVLPSGAYLLCKLLQKTGADKLTISELDNMEGFLLL